MSLKQIFGMREANFLTPKSSSFVNYGLVLLFLLSFSWLVTCLLLCQENSYYYSTVWGEEEEVFMVKEEEEEEVVKEEERGMR